MVFSGKFIERMNCDSQKEAAPRDGTRLGVKLLKGQGWEVGTGLGRYRQGIVEPLAVQATKGTIGIGYKKQKPSDADTRKKKVRKAQRVEKSGHDMQTDDVRSCTKQKHRYKKEKRLEDSIRLSLRTFDETTDLNPLLRKKHRLSDTNPLFQNTTQE